jgi:steroid 5-alpha reductase family enzyme
LTILGLVVWLVGFIFESIGDYQLTNFKRTRKQGELLTSGLWRFTRHPNYFGDAMVWWGYGFFSVANGIYWPVLGSIIMTILLLRVSGVSLLEETLKDSKPGYKEYMQNTAAFFPWFPKKIKV